MKKKRNGGAGRSTERLMQDQKHPVAVAPTNTPVSYFPSGSSGKEPEPIVIDAGVGDIASEYREDTPPCEVCGTVTVRTGAGYRCPNCGTLTGFMLPGFDEFSQ